MTGIERGRRAPRRPLAVAAALGCLAALTLPAAGAELLDGDWRLTWDTTVSYGLQFRVQHRDERQIATVIDPSILLGTPPVALGGSAFSSNVDDGNLNYDTGLVSNQFRLTSEIDLRHRDWFGVFLRGRSFYDVENEDSDRDRLDLEASLQLGTLAPTQLSEAALDRVGNRTELLDAYVSFAWQFGSIPFQFRVGDQVLSWGESTFIPGGINTINPVDVTALRSPGSELRDALLPEGIAWLAFAPSPTTSVELYYQYDWDETELDPAGSYFSTADFIGDDGKRVQLGFGDVPDVGGPSAIFVTDLDLDGDQWHETFLSVPRGPDRDPDDGGQYGAAVRVLLPAIRDTELGFYFVRYHSRLPVLSGTTGTQRSVRDSRNAFRFFSRGTSPSQANALALDVYLRTAGYFAEYPEDIDLFGISFNTSLGRAAIQGEIARRKDAPLQVDDIELILAAISPITFNEAFDDNQLGEFGAGQEVSGFIRRDTTQVQVTVSQLLPPMLGADSGFIAIEAAHLRVHGMPDKDVLRLEAPGTFTSGNPRQSTAPGAFFGLGGVHTGKASEPASAFPDRSSMGYRLAGRLEYLDAIGSVNLLPRFSWQHDVLGISPGPGGPFLEGRTALTLGLAGTYLQSWEADISWTGFFGAGRYNLLNDRDFVSASLKYSF